MFELSDFPKECAEAFTKQIQNTVVSAIDDTTRKSAHFMKEEMFVSPTGTEWHMVKNLTNDYPTGARIGNKDPSFGKVSPRPGNMILDVSSDEASDNDRRFRYQGNFGWLFGDREDYFLEQDMGTYGRGNNTGMGLLNESGGDGPGYIAVDYAKETLLWVMRSEGFSVRGTL